MRDAMTEAGRPALELSDSFRLQATERLAVALEGILRVAEGLARAHRPVDLRGLDDTTGRLCACCLDLPPEQGRALRPVLQHVLARLESLQAALAPPPSG